MTKIRVSSLLSPAHVLLGLVMWAHSQPVLRAADLTAPPSERQVIIMGMLTARTPTTSGRWRTWQNNKHNSDTREADGKRDISSVFYPAIGVYDASDPAYIDYTCQLLSMAGIDAISFYTPSAADAWHMETLTNWVSVMKKYGLKGMPRPQPKTPVQDLDTFMAIFKPVAFLHNGRPLIPFFSSGDSTFLQALAEWKAAFPEPDRPYLVRWLQNSCGPPFDGGFHWAGDGTLPHVPSSARPGWKRYFDARLAREGHDSDLAQARRLIDKGRIKVYLHSVNPGFDDSPVNGWGKGSRYIERDDGEVYRYRWERAVQTGYALACIPTWDDWGEGSVIEPTVEFGNQYLDITREYVAKYKGRPPKAGNFDVPQWIYLIRKATSDPADLAEARKACELLEQGDALAAENVILPVAKKHGTTERAIR